MKRLVIFLTSILLVSACSAAELTKKQEANRARLLSRAIARLAANGGGSLLRADSASVETPARVMKWLKSNAGALVDAKPSPFAKASAWGVATSSGSTLYLQVIKWPEDRKLLVPRLHNSVKSIRLNTSADELSLRPNVHDWEISLPEKPKPRESLLPIVAMELNSAPRVAGTVAPVVKPAADGTILLHSREAIVHGKMLRFEPQPHKNTIGYWVEQDDWAEWSCAAVKTGRYVVELRYGCGNGQGGSDVEFSVGSETFPFQVEATGGFQAWRNVMLGTVQLVSGKTVSVTAKPKRKAENAVMDIQQITLRPVLD